MMGLDKDLGEKIINPITYNYETILKDSKNIQISFPFLCVMIIMFISMLFSNISTLIEINDKSYLRNIIAPVRNRTYFFGMFITSSLIVFFQIMILFFVAQLKFGVNVINVFPKLMFITYMLISVFILIGMCFAYISKSIQSSILITTFFALILFIFANTIAPLETMPTIAENIAEYNPLIIGEFLMKSVQLFNMPITFLLKDISILIIYIIILMSLTLYLSKKKSESRD
jgi:ABC-type multidrug transport system permease subunit